jgi:hypothetical protein
MKKIITLLVLVLFGLSSVNSQRIDAPKEVSENKSVDNNVFKKGEYLKYRIHYGIINAGIAELSINEKVVKQNRNAFHMVGTGRTIGMAEWFFKTRDRYETYIDMDSIVPLEFIRDVNEGGYTIKRHILFDHEEDKAVDLDANSKSFDIDNNAQDLLSTFYYARCINTDNVKVGDEIPVRMFLDHEMFKFYFRYLGKETVDTEFGEIRCKKFIPIVQSGRVFKEKEGMTLWVTDDDNRLPVRLETELAVGSIDIDLISYKNLRHPIEFRK